MRKFRVLILAYFCLSRMFGQQSEQYTQYTFNNLSYNPAYLGTTKCLSFKAGTRMQWMGFEGAPRTTFLSVNHTFGRKHFQNKGKHGVGIYVEQDEVHITTRTYVKLGYAYHKKFTRKLTVGFGVFGGIQQYAINTAFPENTPDPVLANLSGSELKYPDIMPGILLYNDNLYYSFSINQLYFKNIDQGGGESKQVNQYYLGWGHKGSAGAWTLFKTFLLKMNVMGPPSFDANLNWDYRNNIGFGLGYRAGEAVNASMKLRVLSSVTIGYSFDYPLNKLMGNYTHEFMISFSRCPDNGVGGGGSNKEHFCPAYN